MYAAEGGHEAVVRLLLGAVNVNINMRGDLGMTPLFIAAMNGHEAVLRLLLATGDVDINAKSKFGATPLYIAAQNGHEAVVRLLNDRRDMQVRDSDIAPAGSYSLPGDAAGVVEVDAEGGPT